MSTALTKTKGKRMLRDALEGYGEDAFTLSEWDEKKRDAERQGKWTWKQGVANTNAAIKTRFEKDGVQDALKARFVDIQTAMEQEMTSVLLARRESIGQQEEESANQCCWRDCIGGKPYHCTNDLPVDKKNGSKSAGLSSQQTQQQETQHNMKRFCRWHARECDYAEHPMEKSRAIEIPNEFGLCLHCYEATATTQRATLQKAPPRTMAVKIPGVSATDLRRDVQRGALLASQKKSRATGNRADTGKKFTAKSICVWQKEHFEKAYIWRCTNRVLMHPTMSGSYLSFCGFHAPRCIKQYGHKSKKDQPCPSIDRLNGFGMCRYHLEAHMSTLNYEERGACKLVDSEFDVPGIKECSHDTVVAAITRHPLAPKHLPPPPDDQLAEFAPVAALSPVNVADVQESMVKRALFMAGSYVKLTMIQTIAAVLDHPNSVSMLLKEAIWHIQFLRRARVVAIRIQRIFRGKRARRRVRALRFERQALRRIKACLVLQQFVRGFLGCRRFLHEHENVNHAVPLIQRIMRGGFARKRCRELRACIRIQRNYRCYRQRLLAWAFREEMEYMKNLQREADENLRYMEEKLYAFRWLRARRLLRAQMMRWKKQKKAKALEFVIRLQTFWAAVKIQRLWRRHQRYQLIKKRYESAQSIQRRVRGWLTRHMWKEDPGILSVTGFISVKTGFEYGKVVVLAQPSHSYAYPSRRIRMHYGALTVQRLYRGHTGRILANEKWVNMLKRWEWIGIDSTDSSGKSSDSTAVGKERYGFVLPSFGYHEERRLHMKPIVHDIKVGRGFAYKCQNILDLIKDRDGLRAWSLTQEQREQRKRELLADQNHPSKPPPILTPSPKKRRPPALSERISLSKAVFPVGSVVRVAVFNIGKKGKGYHMGKISRINDGVEGEQDTTFDVEYDPVLVTVHGVRIYNEQRVHSSRLDAITHAELVELPPERRFSISRQIQRAISELEKEIRDARLEKQQSLSSSPTNHEREKALESVGALVERLRDDRKGLDLLADDGEFVNFAFRNSTLLKTTWLQVIDEIRYGTVRKDASSQKEPTPSSSTLLPTALDFYTKEFGFNQQNRGKKSSKVIISSKPLPTRATAIEKRMIELGFEYALGATSASAARVDSSYRRDRSQRSETRDLAGFVQAETDKEGNERGSRDDLALEDVGKRVQTSQDIHRLIYKLKTLPIERRREDIIEITTRSTRAFVCGHPACGRCFSSKEAARLHQKSTHEHKERLGLGTPLTDQYMHAYWPPQSPWNRETNAKFQHMVGYFRCSRTGCEHVEFRTHRELNSHLAQIYHITTDFRIPQEDLVISTATKSVPISVTQVVWLGAYAICRHLHDKLGLAKSSLDLGACATHTKVSDAACAACIRQQQCPVLPCRLYSAVALTLSRETGKSQLVHVEEDDLSEKRDSSGYTIFSVEDHEFCPAVHEENLVRATGGHDKAKKKTKNNRPDVKPQSSEEGKEIVFLQVAALCRDNKNEDWVIGNAFHRHRLKSENGPFTFEQRGDAHEVFFDEHLVFTELVHVIGAARIRHCLKSVFYRKFLKSGKATLEATSRSAAACKRDPGGACQEFFWWQSLPSNSLDSDGICG